MKALVVVGGPGVGKSAIVTQLTDSFVRVCSRPDDGRPRREWLFDNPEDGDPIMVELGARLAPHPAGFPGTDALSMSIIRDVETWLSTVGQFEAQWLICEGARLANRRFLTLLGDLGIETHVVLITCVDQVAAMRRADRGSQQRESWVRGAFTRAERFLQVAHELHDAGNIALYTYVVGNNDTVPGAAGRIRKRTGFPV